MNEIDPELVWRAVYGALEGEASTLPGMPSPGIDERVPTWPGDALPYK
jgi:hypothetical protein